MHIHFWWSYIKTSVPSLLRVDCSWCSLLPVKVRQHCKITPGLHAYSGSRWRVRMDMFGERNQGWGGYGETWRGQPGELVPGLTRLWPPVWEIHTSLQSVWDGPCKQSAPFALWKPHISPVEHEQPMHSSAHLGALLQLLLVCWLLTVPDIPDLLQWNLCFSLLQKGVTFYYFPI